MLRRFAILLVVLLLSSLLISIPAAAQTIDISLSASYTFGESIQFQAMVPARIPIGSATLFYIPEGESKTRSGPAEWDQRDTLLYSADVVASPVRAFSTIVYWFEIALQDGQTVQSEKATLEYIDNRFEWKIRASDEFIVHWYEGDVPFAQSLLDTARLGLKNIQGILPVTQHMPIDIYAYDSAMEMRVALQALPTDWMGAHTDADLSVMVVSLPAGPEQRLEMERQIPHELMHLLLYQWLGPGYGNLPAWLDEGLASIAELYPNPDYLVLLDNAVEKDDLPPIASLCDTFPRDASSAFLAYAQATSFTRFLQQQYGSAGLGRLAKAYSDGMSCERGVEAALGSTLTQLEWRWQREAFGDAAATKALINLSPWMIMLVLALLIPIVLMIAGARKRSSTPVSG